MLIEYDLGFGCGTNVDFDRYVCRVFDIPGIEEPNHVINSLSGSSFSFIGEKFEKRWTGTPPSCNQTSNTIEDISFTGTFSSASKYIITIYGARYKKVGSLWVLQGINQTTSIFSDAHTITSKTFSHTRYRAYYSSYTQAVLSVRDTGNPDGETFDEIELDPNNLPNILYDHTLPYSSIKLLRNEDDPTVTDNYEFIPEVLSTHKQLFKIKDGLYYWKVDGNFILSSKATTNDPDRREFPVYDDTYTQSGGTYVATTVNHSFSDVYTYVPDSTDVRFRVRLYLQNPLYVKENPNHEI